MRSYQLTPPVVYSRKLFELTLLVDVKRSSRFIPVQGPLTTLIGNSTVANLKKEAVHWRHFKTREEAQQAIFAYIEGFYNTRRIQKRLDYLSPIQWLRRWENGHLSKVA
jgi:transposase InsO family protein